MTLDVETVVAISLMMAVFSAVATVGTSLALGAGYERLRAGFEIVRKQTGFFSDAIHKLEQKVETVDKQANDFTHSINVLEEKVGNVNEAAGAFSNSMQKLEQKVDIVDRQAGFFGDAIHKLEKKIETIDAHEQILNDKMQRMADTAEHLISAGRAEADAAAPESLLIQMDSLTAPLSPPDGAYQDLRFNIPRNLTLESFQGDGQSVRYH